MFSHTLVIHASDLPHWRGWSPHVWDILSNKDKLTISLLNVEESFDTGDIWKKSHVKLKGSEIYSEINKLLFESEIDLISWACKSIAHKKPTPQDVCNTSYYPKRIPADSQLDLNKSIKEQFNLLRVCDPDRFPAFLN